MSDDDMDELMAALRAQFIAALPDHIAAIGQAWRALSGRDIAAWRTAADELLRRAHRLAGNGAMVGFAAISDAASPVEETLRAAPASGEAPPALTALVARLLEACDAASKTDGA
ncbi:MAG TPA: Hpt domain-containing protein [Stellaceae bacterium]|nr:Hpt domain-containing protein [Stellaceae bacterium]